MFPKVECHPFFYFFAFLSAFTGNFRKMVLISSLILVHEMGHSLMCYGFGFSVDKIVLYPYGGCSFFHMNVNVPIWKEFLILIMGPLFQILFTFLCSFFLREVDFSFLKQVHYALLFFNFLPIYPLDGGKLFLLFSSLFLSYYHSLKLTFFVSFFVYFVFFFGVCFVVFSLFWILVFGLFFFRIWEEEKKGLYLFHKFLLERYLNPVSFKKKKVVSSIYDMKKGYLHYFPCGSMLLSETEYLSRYFSFSSFLSFFACLC